MPAKFDKAAFPILEQMDLMLTYLLWSIFISHSVSGLHIDHDCSIEINIEYEQLNVPVKRNERLIGKTPRLATV